MFTLCWMPSSRDSIPLSNISSAHSSNSFTALSRFCCHSRKVVMAANFLVQAWRFPTSCPAPPAFWDACGQSQTKTSTCTLPSASAPGCARVIGMLSFMRHNIIISPLCHSGWVVLNNGHIFTHLMPAAHCCYGNHFLNKYFPLLRGNLPPHSWPLQCIYWWCDDVEITGAKMNGIIKCAVFQRIIFNCYRCYVAVASWTQHQWRISAGFIVFVACVRKLAENAQLSS